MDNISFMPDEILWCISENLSLNHLSLFKQVNKELRKVLTTFFLEKTNKYKNKLAASVLNGRLFHPKSNMTKSEEEVTYGNLFKENLNLGCGIVGYVTFYKETKTFWRCFLKVPTFFKRSSPTSQIGNFVELYTEPLMAEKVYVATIRDINYLVWDIYDSKHYANQSAALDAVHKIWCSYQNIYFQVKSEYGLTGSLLLK